MVGDEGGEEVESELEGQGGSEAEAEVAPSSSLFFLDTKGRSFPKVECMYLACSGCVNNCSMHMFTCCWF